MKIRIGVAITISLLASYASVGIASARAGHERSLARIQAAAPDAEGAGSTGGGDNLTDDTGAAWFLGSQRVIRSCFEIAPDFGVDAQTAKSEIEGAFAAWQDYISYKFKFAETPLGITTQVSVSPACIGDEDLTFYFGVSTEETRLAKAKYTNPTAFAFKRHYNCAANWGQGWIWFAPPASVYPQAGFPDWVPVTEANVVPPVAEPWALRSMLLHEIGHVLGVGHVSGTIMTERISEKIRNAYLGNFNLISDIARIDQARELTVCWQCEYKWSGGLNISGVDAVLPPTAPANELPVLRANFEMLVGRAPKTEFIGALVRADSAYQGTVLEVFDFAEKHTFPIQFSTQTSSFTVVEDSEPIFKRELSSPASNFSYIASEKVQGVVAYGTLLTRTGENLIIVMERNLPVPERPSSANGFPSTVADYRLKAIRNGQIVPLFEASRLHFELISGPVETNPIQIDPQPIPSTSPTPVL